MILVDANHLAIVSLMAECKGMPEYDENLIRHIFLNQIRNLRKKFGAKYGEIVLCYDSRKSSWRKANFSFYKANRKKARDDSGIDWNKLFEFLNKFKLEIEENFPYQSLTIDGAEADDIIASICKQYTNENHIIVSNDKDFYQLHCYSNVDQYSIYHKSVVKCEHPERYLFEHILRGDKGDGVPNYLSDDDTFINKKRQKSITDKHVAEMVSKKEIDPNWQSSMTDQALENFTRNSILINFDNIPDFIHKEVNTIVSNPVERTRANIYKYFASHGMNLMLENVTEF